MTVLLIGVVGWLGFLKMYHTQGWVLCVLCVCVYLSDKCAVGVDRSVWWPCIMSTDTFVMCRRHKHPSLQGPPQDCKHSIDSVVYSSGFLRLAMKISKCVFTHKHLSMLSCLCIRKSWLGVICSSSMNLSPAHVPSVHTFVIPPGQVVSNRVLLNAVQSEVSMCGWCVWVRQQCVLECVCISLVLDRASLIGSQTQGISVLHNRVGSHREDGPRDSLSASEREASFWNTAPCYSTSQAQLLRRTITSSTSKRDLIIMVVWTGLLHAYTLWTVTCHKHGKDGKKHMCVCSGMLYVGAFWCSCAKTRDRGGCWNAVELPVQWMLMCCAAKMI